MPQKILIVDDDPTVIRLVEATLRGEGYTTVAAEDGLDALVKIKNESPDLIILDVMMPEINGYDVCYQLRFNDEYGHVPIIILTSRDQELSDDISKKENIEYLQKPVNTRALIDKVKTLLSEAV